MIEKSVPNVPLGQMDQRELRKIVRISGRTKAALMTGIAALRRLDTQDPMDPMVSQLSWLTLAWDEVQSQAQRYLDQHEADDDLRTVDALSARRWLH